MEDGVCGGLGVLAIQRQEIKKEEDSAITQHLAMVVHHVLGTQVRKLYVKQVIYIQIKLLTFLGQSGQIGTMHHNH